MASAFTISDADTNPPTGKNILITGASSGIGLATATILLNSGNNVVSLDRAPPQEGAPSALKHISCDITSWQSQRDAFTAAVTTQLPTPTLDAVFVNAGINETGSQLFDEELDADGALAEPNRKTLDIDMMAVVDSLKLAIYHLRNDKRGQKGGSIVMTASLAGYMGTPRLPLYSGAKHGVVGLMRGLKMLCSKVGISISIVAPGISLTPILVRREGNDDLESWGKRMKENGVAVNTAEDVARVVVWLMGSGTEANGKGILILNAKCCDAEAGLLAAREQWMGKEIFDLFQAGRPAPAKP